MLALAAAAVSSTVGTWTTTATTTTTFPGGPQAQFQVSPSGWGCPFSGEGNSNPCENGDCLASRNDGYINRGCCNAIAEYCEINLDTSYASNTAADPACTDSSMVLLFQSFCADAASAESRATATTSIWNTLSHIYPADDANSVSGATNFDSNCPFSRPYDNPCYTDSCAADASHGGMSDNCCASIEEYCAEEIDNDPACRNPELAGLFFVFCNSSFADPNDEWSMPPPKGAKGGLAGGSPHSVAGTMLVIGMAAGAAFYGYRHYKAQRIQNLNQHDVPADADLEAPLLHAPPVPPKYDEPHSATVVKSPPSYNSQTAPETAL